MIYKYLLYKPSTDKKTGLPSFAKFSSHASYNALLRAFEKKKIDEPKIFMVLLPIELKVGQTLYKQDESAYGDIVGEEEHFYVIQRPIILEPPPTIIVKAAKQPIPSTKKKKATTKRKGAMTAASISDEQDVFSVQYENVETPRTFANDIEREKFMDRLNEPVLFAKHRINYHFINGFSGKYPGFIIPLSLRK